ncbi:hypothetical protein BGZ73_007842 [Actinomortierella ambigua]|nr:hypothetical protein BGZ73_007842 [Actinomortierella ambigua]
MVYTKSLIATALASIALLSNTAEAAPVSMTPARGQTGAILSEDKFCFFLPPMAGGNIAKNEDRAVAFCTTEMASAPKASIFPPGFIKSAHFMENKEKGWVQITGRMDITKYKLSPSDGGGQYDIKAPRGALCAGYNHFVNLVEPSDSIYCIRCCKEKIDCNTGRSEYGCKGVLRDGNYSYV